MNSRLLHLLPLAILAAPGYAHASGWYVVGAGGVSYLQSADNTFDDPPVDVKSSYKTGWVAVGGAGYAFSNGLRIEAEAGYRHVRLKKLDIREDGGLGAVLGVGSLNGVTTRAYGTESALSGMLNAWYELDTGTPVGVYVGGGIGIARISIDNVKTGGPVIVDDTDTVFAYQVGAGVSYAFTPKARATLEYRFFGTTQSRFTDISGDFNSEFHNHSVLLGARIGF